MTQIEITIRDNGPYRIIGPAVVKDAAGNVLESGDNIVLCRCGQSNRKPFCDGTHRTCGFESSPRAAE